MGFCECTVKFALYLFNLVCALLGLAIIVIAVMANSHGSSLKNMLNGEITTTSIVLIVIGSLVFIIAFFGCCGAIRESSCMITTYAVFLSIILLVQVAIGVLAYVYSNQFQDAFSKYISKQYEDYDNHPETVDIFQQELKCCGPQGKANYVKNVLPLSCCDNWKNIRSCPMEDAYSAGCISTAKNLIQHELKNIGLSALVIAGVELLCVICAFCLAGSIRREERRAYA